MLDLNDAGPQPISFEAQADLLKRNLRMYLGMRCNYLVDISSGDVSTDDICELCGWLLEELQNA
jgi:hypothetical protein